MKRLLSFSLAPLLACGAGTAGGSSEPAAASSPTVISGASQSPPLAMLSDGTTLFWITSTDKSLVSMPVAGGAITPLASSLGSSFLGADVASLYFTSSSGICSLAKAGGAVTTIVTASSIGGATILDGILFWVENGAGPGAQNKVRSMPLPQGPITELGEVEGTLPPNWIAATASTVFVGELTTVKTIPRAAGASDGGAAATLTLGECFPPILSDDAAIYCGEPAALNAITGDGTVTLLSAQANPDHLAIDTDHVYWANNDSADGSEIRVMSRTGGAVTTIATTLSIFSLTVDDQAVYWADNTGVITRVAK